MTTATDNPGTTDRIEKQFEVRATRTRVWRALADATEFGTWFRIAIDGPFVAGATVLGKLGMPGCEHITLELQIVAMEPERYFAYRWHPYAVDPAIDYSAEPTTLVEFHLEDIADGTSITITESGFDRLPASRRAEAFRMNDAGWTGQSKRLASYVS